MIQIIDTNIEQHAEEAAFLWLLRSQAVRAPHYALKDLAKLDNRVEAHLDGLRIAGDAGWDVCKEAFDRQEPGEVFAAAVLAFQGADERRIKDVLAAAGQSPKLSRGLVSALGWLPLEQALPYMERLLMSESSVQRRMGVAASAVHRHDPGSSLQVALRVDGLSLKACALKAVGELGRRDLIPTLLNSLAVEDERYRFWAAWSAALLGEPSAIPVLQDLAEQGGKRAESACAMVTRSMSLEDAQGWQRELANRSETLRMAVQGLGVIGDPVGIPWLIEQMATPELARVAGESFTMITGVDIAYKDLEGEKPDFEAGPTEDPDDNSVEMDADEDLPWPDPQLIEQWWDKHHGEFQNGVRYLIGKPITAEWAKEVLKIGRQRQRAAAALELAMLQPGQPLFEVRAPGFRQMALLQ